MHFVVLQAVCVCDNLLARVVLIYPAWALGCPVHGPPDGPWGVQCGDSSPVPQNLVLMETFLCMSLPKSLASLCAVAGVLSPSVPVCLVLALVLFDSPEEPFASQLSAALEHSVCGKDSRMC